MGEQFTIALSSRGYVYTWGMNDKGQLGLGIDSPSYEPMQVP
jgi:alpha-tubulin suppressor-like RCC1 family protein